MSGLWLRSRRISPVVSCPSSPAASLDPEPQMETPGQDTPAEVEDKRLSQIEQTLNKVVDQLARLTPAAPTHLPPPQNFPGPDPIPFSRPFDPVLSPVQVPSTISVRNRRYLSVLAVDTYRLRDRTSVLRPDQVATLTSYANQIRPRLEGCFFGGDPPLMVLPFLHQLVRVADQSHMSEALLLWVLEDFLRSPVKEAFRSQHLNLWPEAVHWFLVTYAAESMLESAVRRLQTTSQSSNETVRQFGLRLQMEASALGSLLDAVEIKSLFAQGLRDPVRSLFAAHQPPIEQEDATPVSVLIARAELLETGSRAVVSPPLGSRYPNSPPRLGVLAMQVGDQQETFDEVSQHSVLALDSRNTKADTSRWTCFVCYKSGHGWLDCPWLADVSPLEKEDAAVRRRRYLEQRQAAFPSMFPGTSSWAPSSRLVSPNSPGAFPQVPGSTNASPPLSQKNGPASPRS
jgi:hypothetical protein